MSQSLCAGDFQVVFASDAASDNELAYACDERGAGQQQLVSVPGGVLTDQERSRVAHDDRQRYGPQVERDRLPLPQCRCARGQKRCRASAATNGRISSGIICRPMRSSESKRGSETCEPTNEKTTGEISATTMLLSRQ